MSFAAEQVRRPELPPSWQRLERAAQDASVAVGFWRTRAQEAEGEVLRLRRALEELAAGSAHPTPPVDELRRLRAENAALRSRMIEARKRVGALMRRLVALGIEP